MSDKTSLEFIGTLLRQIQAEQGTLRAENHLIRMEMGRLVGRFATRDEILEAFRALTNRIGDFEVVVEARFGQLTDKLAQIDEKLGRQE
jgi:hypothetical protein